MPTAVRYPRNTPSAATTTRTATTAARLACIALAAALALLAMPSPARAQEHEIARVASPGKMLDVAVQLAADGRATYTIARRGTPVIAPSHLGFILGNAPKLDRGFSEAAPAQTRTQDDTWEQPWGERRYVRDHYNELRVHLKDFKGRKLDVVFRAFDDGVGFRYEFPDQPALHQVDIVEELTEFVVAAPGSTAWWIPAGEFNRYEQLYRKTPLDQVGQAHTPMTLRTPAGLHVAIHEAALVDYSAMWLRRFEGQTFRAALSPSSTGPKVSRTAPFNTPWRTLRISEDAAGLAMSDIDLNLNEPNKLGDVRQWFKPFKYVGIWWGMHLDQESWSSGPKHGATTANAKKYIDFAADNGFRGVLIEGWNKGWDGDWFANGADFDFTHAYPDFDLEAVAAYAKSKGVHLIGHHETGGNIAVYEPQLEAALDLYQRLGIDGVKTGYVADAGGIQARAPDGSIRYEWHDGQLMSRHHLHVVQEAAKRHIAVDPHEPIKDTGLRRTYPNWVSREGARGMEYNAWGTPPNPPEHEANLVFTRMLSGPMDFTPGIVSLQGKKQVLQSTLAKQLALYVVIYSPIQMAADLPENYAANPRPFQFIKDVPADWSDSRVLNGEVGDFVTFARKDRDSEDWYLGAVTDENARTLNARLDFLTPGKRYRAQVYKDGPTADYRTEGRHDMAVEERLVTSKDTLTLQLAPGGGQAIRFDATP
jgi:alpha-glucosidase